MVVGVDIAQDQAAPEEGPTDLGPGLVSSLVEGIVVSFTLERGIRIGEQYDINLLDANP
jgi:hypothetical protein